MEEDISFLKKSELFRGLPEKMLYEILDMGQLLGYGPNEYIIKEGDESFDLYVIKEGVVEVIVNQGNKVITYLSEGESFGEMALITGDKRSASIRVPERAVVFKLPAEIYEKYLSEDKIFLRRMCEVLAMRLKRSNLEVTRGEHKKKLYGKLKYFDLPTILQTIFTSKETGILRLENPEGFDAEIIFFDGNVINVFYKNLEPEEGFYQVFLDLEKFTEFRFTEKEEKRILVPKMAKDLNTLLMNSMKIKDEFGEKLKETLEKIGGKNKKFRKTSKNLIWKDTGTIDCATQIWIMIEENFSFKDILDGCDRAYHVVLYVINEMLKSGLIE